LHAWFSAARRRLRIGWLLLALVAISQISLPLTQHLWAWDRFLHGGQDFETGAFLILVSLCLVIVMMRACKSAIEHLLASLRMLSVRPAPAAPAIFLIVASPCAQQGGEHPYGAIYCLPMQI
jgi:hypothetical protein